MTEAPATKPQTTVSFTILVASLGYFVDIFDLVLFGVVRKASLAALGVPPELMLEVGGRLLRYQMLGMLLGGIAWGMLGDKRGRLSVLFGSIFLYSIATIANAFVTDMTAYGALRFVAGFGLAGELGAAITLVAELLPTDKRGIGTTIVASIGVTGAVAAALIGKSLGWKAAYISGGVLGLILLITRFRMAESSLFSALGGNTTQRGDFLMLFRSKERLGKFLWAILTGVPIWFVVGVLVFFSDQYAAVLGVTGSIAPATSIMFCYIGLAGGDLTSGLLSQLLKSRRKAVLIYLVITIGAILIYLNARNVGSTTFYALNFLMGFGIGYWAVFVTTAAEQFGTNLRATVAISVPNFVRGSVDPMLWLFNGILMPRFGLLQSSYLLGGLVFLGALFALLRLKESYSKNLDYLELP